MNRYSTNIDKFEGGFILTVSSTTVGDGTFILPSQEIIKQQIRLSDIKCIKVYNTGNNAPLVISSDIDYIIFGVSTGGVQPIAFDSEFKIRTFWGSPSTYQIVCYYKHIGGYSMPIPAF